MLANSRIRPQVGPPATIFSSSFSQALRALLRGVGALRIYPLTKSFPDDKRFGMTSQRARAVARQWHGRSATVGCAWKLYTACCAGLDVHKDMVMACVRTMADGKISYESKSFGTTTKALLELGEAFERGDRRGVLWPGDGAPLLSDRDPSAAIDGLIGLEMSRFPSEHHLVSWACLCPRLDESAGKRRTSKIQRGCNWLKTHMVQAAWGGRKKERQLPLLEVLPAPGSPRLQEGHRGRRRRHAPHRHHLVRAGVLYEDVGPGFYARRDQEETKNRLVRRLEALGFGVELTPAA